MDEDIEELRRAGPLRIEALVDASGWVTDVHVTMSSHSNLLDRMMRSSVREMRFEPARLDGVPVPGWRELVIEGG